MIRTCIIYISFGAFNTVQKPGGTGTCGAKHKKFSFETKRKRSWPIGESEIDRYIPTAFYTTWVSLCDGRKHLRVKKCPVARIGKVVSIFPFEEFRELFFCLFMKRPFLSLFSPVCSVTFRSRRIVGDLAKKSWLPSTLESSTELLLLLRLLLLRLSDST
jgi:hypothetical protein